jgi:hypothetical protein
VSTTLIRQLVRSALSSESAKSGNRVVVPTLVEREHAEVAGRVAHVLVGAEPLRLGEAALEQGRAGSKPFAIPPRR